MTGRFLILLLLAIANSFSAVQAETQAHRIKHFTNRQLATTTLSDFCKDDEGFVWIGTGTGLLRFDGASFDSFFYDDTNPHSLSDNRVNKLLYDSHSRLWAATCEGLNLYRPESDDFARVSLPGIEFNGYISDLCECSDGSVAFVAAGIGVYKVFPNDSTLMAVKIDLPEGAAVNSIVESSPNRLAGGTHDGKLVIIDMNGTTRQEEISDSYIRFLTRDSNGDILVFCNEHILKWNENAGVKGVIRPSDGRNPDFTTATLRKDGSVIAASEKHGLYIIEKGSYALRPASEFKISAARQEASLSALYEDAERNLWIGIRSYGALMAVAEEPTYEHISLNEVIENFHPGPVLTIADGNTLWCGLADGRLLNMDLSGNLLSIRKFSNAISSLSRSCEGKILAGVDHEGLYEIDTRGVKSLFRPEGKFQGSSIACASDGTIYFGLLGGGVTAVNPTSGAAEALTLGNDNLIWVSSLFCDSLDRLWIGMYGALVVHDLKSKETVYLSHLHPQLCKGVHNSIAEKGDGTVWSATSNGLFIIDPEDWSYRHISVKDGLPDMFVSSIAFDNSRHAWIGTHEEMAQIEPSLQIRTHRIGGNIDDFGFSCAIIDQDRVILSGNKGITIFHRKRLSRPYTPRPPHISGFFLDGSRLTKSSMRPDGKSYVPASNKINLLHDNGNLTVRLAVDDFARGENRAYLWRIPGIYDSWTRLPAGINSVTLPHLSPGSYSLTLKTEEEGIESAPLEVDINVSAPWYLTITAKIIYVMAIFAIILLAWLYYKEKKRQRIEQEKIKYIVDTTEEMWQPVMKGNDEKLIKRISDIVNGNLHDSSFNVEKLGEEAGLSRAHLNRKMKELFGMSPSEFLRNAKMKQACELLKNEDLDIAQVAFRVGFCTQAHFANSFKRFTGKSPSDYRATQKGG